MRLLYIYIHDYRCIYQQGFNLSSDYDISFSFDYDSKNNKYFNPSLKIETINHNLPHLFNENIVDIKAIIGENGAGKTTLLNFLSFECHEHEINLFNSDQGLKNILIYETIDTSNNKTINIYYGSDWRLSSNNIINLTGVPINRLYPYKPNLFWGQLPDFQTTSFIFYSNVFDNSFESEYNGLINISTNHLIRKDIEKYSNLAFPSSETTAHNALEMMRQVYFCLNYTDYIPFNLPKHIHINFNDVATKSIHRLILRRSNAEQYFEKFEKLYTDWESVSNDSICHSSKNKNKIIEALFNRSFINYFIWNQLINVRNQISGFFIDFDNVSLSIFDLLISEFRNKNGNIVWDELLPKITEYENSLIYVDPANNTPKGSFSLGDSSFSFFIRKFSILNSFILNIMADFEYRSPSDVRVPINANSLPMLEKYSNTLRLQDYLFFYFSGLSSGEQSFLTLFSRFFSLNNSLIPFGFNLESHKRNLIILIDEGDLYFHPKWQTYFINYINEVLPKIFPGKSIQIILTSHSQFVASDLPSNNILFLKKGSDNDPNFSDGKKALYHCSIATGPNVTFAANIHDLLADSFFLEGAHIGAFAKQIICNLLDQFERVENSNKYSNDEIIALINIIGDSWLKNRLLEKFEVYKSNSSNQ